MHDRIRGLRPLCALAIAAIAALVVSACGSSSGSGNASSLLNQTFTGSHNVNSGNLNFSVTVNPSGSSTLTEPITLSFGGPFQSLGTGKLPKSNFNVSISAQGQSGSLGILSTGTSGYVTLQGTSYQLPAATFRQLESSFVQLASSPGGNSSGSGTLSKIGIHPLDWLVSPTIVGTESVGGASTTHIRADVNVTSLLADLNTFLHKAGSLGVSGTAKLPSSISAAARSKIAAEIQHPTFDVWTGNKDKTVRKLQIKLTVPVTGQISTALGGLSSAQIGISMQYSDLNQPQTITAPTNIRPYSEFSAKLQSFLSAVQGLASSTGASGSASSGSTTASGSPSATSATSATGSAGAATTGASGTSTQVQAYGQCLSAAHNDITKMQKCASLINGQ
jgi:hypothetical protein